LRCQHSLLGSPLFHLQYGLTALSGAAKYGKLELVSFLLTLDGILVHTRDKQGVSTLLHAVTMSDLPMVQRILEVDDVDVAEADITGRTVLIQAAHRGETKIMAEAIGRGDDVNINGCNEQGMTALMTACAAGQLSAVRMLLEVPGIRVNQKDIHNLSALMHAVLKNKTAVILLLLSRPDVDVNTADLQGSTVFMQVSPQMMPQ
jgi:ankyrin repeat protein